MNAAVNKSLTKVAVTYHPPTFKFEYTRDGSFAKYHKRINLVKWTNFNSQCRIASTEEFSQEITKALVERYTELTQIPSIKIERLMSKLLSKNPNLSETSPMQVNMTISKGSLLVTPLRERPKLQRTSSVSSDAPVSSEEQEKLTAFGDLNKVSEQDLISAKGEMTPVSSEEQEKLTAFGDLNKVSEQDLMVAKGEMTKVYEKNNVLPGDDTYMYDKRVEFHSPDEESSWD